MSKQQKSAALGGDHGDQQAVAKRDRTSPADHEEIFRIEQVADLTGLTRRTLRYYEERGLLDPPTRTEGNYRLYTAADVDHIKRVKRIRELLGASLAEIKEMVAGEEARQAFRDEWAQTPDPAARIALLDRGEAVVERQLAVVRARMAELRDLEDTLTYKQSRYMKQRDDIYEQIALESTSRSAGSAAK